MVRIKKFNFSLQLANYRQWLINLATILIILHSYYQRPLHNTTFYTTTHIKNTSILYYKNILSAVFV